MPLLDVGSLPCDKGTGYDFGKAIRMMRGEVEILARGTSDK